MEKIVGQVHIWSILFALAAFNQYIHLFCISSIDILTFNAIYYHVMLLMAKEYKGTLKCFINIIIF